MQSGRVARFIERQPLGAALDGKVPTQFGPGRQEMGGFWLKSASALQNAALGLLANATMGSGGRGRAPRAVIDAAWQAPQVEHGWQLLASSASSGWFALSAWPAQWESAANSASKSFSASKPNVAHDLLAGTAMLFIAWLAV